MIDVFAPEKNPCAEFESAVQFVNVQPSAVKLFRIRQSSNA